MDSIRVVAKAPGTAPEIKHITNDLQGMKPLVGGGYIETCPCGIPGVLIVCDEEGKLKNLPYNFSLPNDHIVGPCFFVGDDGPEFASLTDDQVYAVMSGFGAV